jgi:hypothetical protein
VARGVETAAFDADKVREIIAGKGEPMISSTKKFRFDSRRISTFLAGMLVILIASIAGAADNEPLDVSQQALKVVQSSPLVAGGVNLGTVVVYDDPSTHRTADYLELFDGQGGLIAVSWFDRFGIQRIAVDRGFVAGQEDLEGIFVAVVDGSFI